jgi:hypothetical protein
MADYQQEVYRMRMERKQAETEDRLEQLRQQYNNALENRENAALQMVNNDDPSEWRYWDSEMEDAERQLAPFLQAQQPRQDPRAAEWVKRNSAFFERYGQRGINAVRDAHAYLLRPRNENTNNPAYTGMGVHPSQAYSPEYFKKLEDVLEMHAEMYHGIKFDPKEKSLTANEACEVSGLSPNQYNEASRAAAAAGKYNK